MSANPFDVCWSGADETFLDAPSIIQCGPVVLGRYGGSALSGARKNEDAALIWADPDNSWIFAALLDAHGSSDSAQLVLDRLQELKPEIPKYLQSYRDSLGTASPSLWRLGERIIQHLQAEEFRRSCRAVQGETALMLCAQIAGYIWWLSIGDIPLYVFHPEFAALGQFALNQRMFYEWIGQANTFSLTNPGFTNGVRQLRPGNSRILLTTDGLLECGSRFFENPRLLYDLFATSANCTQNEGSDIALAVQKALAHVQSEAGRDSATLIAWETQTPVSGEILNPNA